MLSPNGCLYPPSQRFATDGIAPPIPAGTVLRLTGGAMEGIEGLCEWSDGRRVRLLMTILGRPVAVTADRAAVEMT